MSEAKPNETEPLFWAFGHAVYAAQLLEHGVKLLLMVIAEERKKQGLPKFSFNIDNPKSHKTLGTLFNDVLKIEFINKTQKKIIWSAVRDRNILVHSYWGTKQTMAMLKPEGRDWLIKDLLRYKENCRKADKIISNLIDQYLSKYGTSVDEISSPFFEQWENNEQPPENVLH